jgi:hypothetical protein
VPDQSNICHPPLIPLIGPGGKPLGIGGGEQRSPT